MSRQPCSHGAAAATAWRSCPPLRGHMHRPRLQPASEVFSQVWQIWHQNLDLSDGYAALRHLPAQHAWHWESTSCRPACLQSGEAHGACRGMDEHRVARPNASDALQRLLRGHKGRRQRGESRAVPGGRHCEERRGGRCDGGPQAAVRDAPDTLAHREAAVGAGARAQVRHSAGTIGPCSHAQAEIDAAAGTLSLVCEIAVCDEGLKGLTLGL